MSQPKTIINNVPKAIEAPEDYTPELKLWVTLLPHNLINTGRAWLGFHAIEHELMPYMILLRSTLSIIFPAGWNTFIPWYKRFLLSAWDADLHSPPEEIALEGINRMIRFQNIGLPVTLTEAISEDKFEEMADKCTDLVIYNTIKLNREDIVNIYRLAK